MKKSITKEDLIEFEKRIAHHWENAEIPYPVHLSGGNEDFLIKIFDRVKEGDYIFSTHRSHYHYLLAGGSQDELEKKIMDGKSMYVYDKNINFLSSAIVSGNATIAAGVALGLKMKNSKNHVWCFSGDGAEDEGHFYEAVRYVEGHKLPCIFILEDNGLSVETPKKERYGNFEINWPSCVERYSFKPTYPHLGTGASVNFKAGKAGGSSF